METTNKGKWYKCLVDKMVKAIENEYYFEAIFIEYMLIDDRIKALSVLAGIDLNKSDNKPKMLGQLVDELNAAKKCQTVDQWKLLDKGIPLADKEFLKSIKEENYPREKIIECTHVPRHIISFRRSKNGGKYLSEYGDVDAAFLIQIKAWVDKRNHWMHAAANDPVAEEDYKSEIRPLAIDGDSFFRELSDITGKIRREINKENRKKM